LRGKGGIGNPTNEKQLLATADHSPKRGERWNYSDHKPDVKTRGRNGQALKKGRETVDQKDGAGVCGKRKQRMNAHTTIEKKGNSKRSIPRIHKKKVPPGLLSQVTRKTKKICKQGARKNSQRSGKKKNIKKKTVPWQQRKLMGQAGIKKENCPEPKMWAVRVELQRQVQIAESGKDPFHEKKITGPPLLGHPQKNNPDSRDTRSPELSKKRRGRVLRRSRGEKKNFCISRGKQRMEPMNGSFRGNAGTRGN